MWELIAEYATSNATVTGKWAPVPTLPECLDLARQVSDHFKNSALELKAMSCTLKGGE